MSRGRFVVLRRRGIAWDATRPMERQRGWDEHAAVMDRLTADRFVLAGGPLADGDILLIVQADRPEEIAARLAADPWTGTLLETTRIAAWTLRLGAIG